MSTKQSIATGQDKYSKTDRWTIKLKKTNASIIYDFVDIEMEGTEKDFIANSQT